MSADRLHVIIVGGGILGCCTAYYLARAGVQVTLLERSSLCAEASSAAAGLVTLSTREGLLLEMARESLRLLREAADEFGNDFELIQDGSLVLLRTEEELLQQRAFVEKQQARGVDIHFLNPQATLELEPAASPEVLGSVFSPLDSLVNGYVMTLAFGRAARRLGASLRTGVEVTAIKAEGGRVRTAVTAEGEVTGDFLVVAAGAWTPLLTRTVGLDLPVEPSRGQVLITEPFQRLSRCTIKNVGHTYVFPTIRGNHIIGSVSEWVGFDKSLTPDRLKENALEASHLVPSLRQVRILRSWAGLRPMTPDSQPLLGEVEGYPGLVLASGHSRTGICFGPVTSKMVADLLTTGRAGFPMEPFDPKRFAPAA